MVTDAPTVPERLCDSLGAHVYELQALTDIWTGTARVERQFVKKTQRQELVDVIDSSRLIQTGLLGSIRW